MRTLLLLTLILAIPSQAANAFGQDGFSIGMSKATTRAVAISRGWQLIALKIDGMYRLKSADQDMAVINFCDDGLFSHSIDLAGGISAFIRSAESESRLHGPASSSTRRDVTTRGEEFLSIEAAWDRGASFRSLIFARIGGDEQVTREDRRSKACAD